MFVCFGASAANIPDSLKRVLNRTKSDTAKVNVLIHAADISMAENADLAMDIAQKALGMALNTNYRLGVAKAYYQMGNASFGGKKSDECVGYFLKAAKIFDSLHNIQWMAATNCSLGDAVANAHNYKEALLYYRKSEKEYLSLHDTLNAVVQQMSIAGTLGNMGMLDSSLFYSEKMLPVAIRLKDENLIGKIECNIGGVYMEKHEYRKALSYIKKSLSYFEKNAPPWDLVVYYYSITRCYTSLKEYDSAQKYGAKNYKMNIEQGNIDGIISSEKYLANVYVKTGKYSEAASLYRDALTRSDSMYDLNTTKQVAEMQTLYETEKKDEQLKLQQSELSKQKLIIYGSFAFAAFVILVLIILFINFRKINKLSKKLAIQTEELQELNTVKNKLFSAISHDLRSPLGRVTNMLYMMQRGGITEEKLKARSIDFLNTMQQTMQMLDNLLYWATGQMKGLTIQKTEIDIEEIVDENIDLMQGEAGIKHITLINNLGKGIKAQADINMTRLILRNLISNAIKFTPEGGKVTADATIINNRIKISISDTGIGMDAEMIQGLSSNKQLKSRTGTNTEKGFGIGLQLCKDFAEMNGGVFSVESEPGKGSTFSFTLPIS